MSATLLHPPGLGPIQAGILYPLPDLQLRSGLGNAAFREMRREGLKVIYKSGRAYVFGEDFLSHVREHGKTDKNA